MKRLTWIGFLAVLLILLSGLAWSQEEEPKAESQPGEEVANDVKQPAGRKELPVAGTPYIYTGPDTGAGAGAAIMYRNMGGKAGRDGTFSLSYTQTQYQNYSLEWTEPDFITKGPRFNLKLEYDNKPARRFYGYGNDTETDAVCNWGWDMFTVRPAIIYPRGNAKWRVRLNYSYHYVKAKDGALDDPNDPLYSRPISRQFPEIYHSKKFESGAAAGPGLYLYYDTRRDKFPLGGGREMEIYPVEGSYNRLLLNYNGPAVGSDFEYDLAMLDLRQYLGFFNDNTVLVLRGKMIVSSGDMPLWVDAAWDTPSFGGGSDLRGYYDGRFRGEASSQYNIELRQGIAPNWNWELFKGAIKLHYPFLFAFFEAGRVYDSYDEIGENIFKDYHPSYGGGFRFIITPSVVIRFEMALSPEQTAFIVSANEPF